MSESSMILGDCLTVLPTIAAGSVDAVVTDPPYDFLSASRKGSQRDRRRRQRVPRRYDRRHEESGPRIPPADIDERIARMTERAGRGVPLFG